MMSENPEEPAGQRVFEFQFSEDDIGDQRLEAAVGQAVGFGSVCWESMEGTGVFQDHLAMQAVNRLLEFIRADREEYAQQKVVEYQKKISEGGGNKNPDPVSGPPLPGDGPAAGLARDPWGPRQA